MSVLLVHVPVGFEEAYPLALGAIAAPVVEAGYAVEGLDVGRVGLEGLASRLGRGGVELVGTSVWSPAIAEVRELVRVVREADPRITVVVGGPHATLAPEEVEADVTVMGEGEQAFLDVVESVAAGRPPAGRVEAGKPLNFSKLSAIDRTVFSVEDYHRDHLPRGRRYASDITSRGCLHSCAYCSAPAIWGRGHRSRPAEQVVATWQRLRVDHGVDGVLVEDDLFTQRRARVVDLCEALIRAQRPVTFELLNGVRPETLDAELLDLMAQAGMVRLALSIETASEDRLSAMGRSPDRERVSAVVQAAKQVGIGVTGYFMIGLPGETLLDRNATFEYAATLGLDMAHFSVASAWPGTDWAPSDLTEVPPAERAGYYASWYLHPMRALRAARMLGVKPAELPRMVGRLHRWMTRPLEARRAG